MLTRAYTDLSIITVKMNCLSEESQYNSSEDDFQLAKPGMRGQQNSYKAANRGLEVCAGDDGEELALKPKFKNQEEPKQTRMPNSSKVMTNASKVTIESKKNIMNSYTFKRQQQKSSRRKVDPVSLYAQAKHSWSTNKFLKSRADAKEGRKLELDKRNKIVKIL